MGKKGDLIAIADFGLAHGLCGELHAVGLRKGNESAVKSSVYLKKEIFVIPAVRPVAADNGMDHTGMRSQDSGCCQIPLADPPGIDALFFLIGVGKDSSVGG